MLPLLLLALADPPDAAELPVAPYVQSNANAGADPIEGDATWRAFHERAGVIRIVDDFVGRIAADPVIGEILVGQDLVRLRRTLKEQFCYLLGGGCAYTGRSMRQSHADLGIQAKDMNVLVADLQRAMDAERVPFFAQNRLLAKLAPMRKDVVTR